MTRANCNLIEIFERNTDLFLRLIIIMYADGIVLLANSAFVLQKAITLELKQLSLCHRSVTDLLNVSGR